MIRECFVTNVVYDKGRGAVMVVGEISGKDVFLEFYRKEEFIFREDMDEDYEMEKTASLLRTKIQGHAIKIDFQGDAK